MNLKNAIPAFLLIMSATVVAHAAPGRYQPPGPIVDRYEPQRPYYPPPYPPAPQEPQRQIVTCSSDGGRLQRCYVGRAYVRFLDRISNSPCTQNVSWGFDRRAGQIWVKDGCRARFEVISSGGYEERSTLINCESVGGRERSCGGNLGFIYGVEIESQYSNSPCDYNVSWGYDSRYVWVKNGCRATFRVYN